MKIDVLNVAAWTIALEKLEKSIEPAVFARELAMFMRRFVHIHTGFLKSTIYSYGDKAGATAVYAGYEAARGGSHDFVERAIMALDIDKKVTEGINGFY